MKLLAITIVCCLFLTLTAMWADTVLMAHLRSECKPEPKFKQLGNGLKLYLGFSSPKEPPWGNRWLCPIFNLETHEKLQTYAMAVIFSVGLMVYLALLLNRKKEKLLKKDLWALMPRPPMCTCAYKNNNNTPPVAKVDKNTTFDGHIFVPHVLPGAEKYRSILLGPISQAFAAIRLRMVETFLVCFNVHEVYLKWSHKFGQDGTPEFMGVRHGDIRVEVRLVPGQGINMDVLRLGPQQGLVREVTHQTYQMTYRGMRCTDEGTSPLYGTGWED